MQKIKTFSLSSLFLYFLPLYFLNGQQPAAVSPLSDYSKEWDSPAYAKCNTAASTSWLTQNEKEVIYILNMARSNPSLFLETVIKKYPSQSGKGYVVNSSYYKSLLTTFKKMKALNLLYPDSLCFESAKCHAISSGSTGYVGHDRTVDCQKKQHFNGECCDYGSNNALDILMHLLIDDGVPSLGHRDICTSEYNKIGVSIQKHSAYGFTAVLDFSY